ncbi:SixA phosphatase family protein [Flavitalea flava]
MKTLLIIRHAKSSWEQITLSDKDRPLNERGKRDAPEMARRLIKAGIKIDLFVSSPAKRARDTAEFFIREFGGKEKDIVLVPELYHAGIPVFTELVADLDDRYDTVAIFSHNPGITSFVNSLTTARLDNMPTAGVFAVTSPAVNWSEFIAAGTTFLFFDYPKSGSAD